MAAAVRHVPAKAGLAAARKVVARREVDGQGVREAREVLDTREVREVLDTHEVREARDRAAGREADLGSTASVRPAEPKYLSIRMCLAM